MQKFHDLRQRLHYLPITYRIAIGNTLIIAVGAVGGTLLTRHFASQAAELWLILLYLFIGTTLSVLTNFWIIRTALRPLHELSQLVNRMQAGKTGFDPNFLQDNDPDISQLAIALNSLVKQLEERNLELRALSKRAISAQEEERKRIARSLHDETGQALSMLIIHLEQLQDRISADEIEIRKKLDASHQIATRALAELRNIVYGLRPSILDDLGLIPAIRWYARSHLEEAGIRLEICAPERSLSLPTQLNSTLFRIAQEGINNVLRHSQAKSVCISLDDQEEEIRLLIQDDGQGFDLIKTSEQAIRLQQLGLLGIQERANLVGGKVTVESFPGQGTSLQVSLPITSRGE